MAKTKSLPSDTVATSEERPHKKVFAFVPEVFTIESAAHYLGVSARTVEEYIAADQLHTFRLPSFREQEAYLKRTLIRRSELDALIGRGLTL